MVANALPELVEVKSGGRKVHGLDKVAAGYDRSRRPTHKGIEERSRVPWARLVVNMAVSDSPLICFRQV